MQILQQNYHHKIKLIFFRIQHVKDNSSWTLNTQILIAYKFVSIILEGKHKL